MKPAKYPMGKTKVAKTKMGMDCQMGNCADMSAPSHNKHMDVSC